MILSSLILFHPPATAQSPLTAAILDYTGSPAADSRLYNGPLYLGYDRHAQGHPFFLTDSLLPGSIDYGGIRYPDIRLSYDIFNDLVIIPDKKTSSWLQLLTEKLPGFTIGGHAFTYLASDSNAVNAPDAGYYELLYAGKARALARHRKVVHAMGKPEDDQSAYRQYDYWYLEMNNRYIPIRSQKNLLAAFGAGDKGLRSLLHANNISFKKDPASAMTAAAKLLSR